MNVSRRVALATSLGLGVSAVTGLALPTHADAACNTNWGSNEKTDGSYDSTTGLIWGYRSGQHACHDRLVLDIGSGHGTPGHWLSYTDSVFDMATGDRIPVQGGAVLALYVNAWPENPSHRNNETFTGWRTFRQFVGLGAAAGQTGYALGVRARLPMRIFLLTDNDGWRRLVVDVAHTW